MSTPKSSEQIRGSLAIYQCFLADLAYDISVAQALGRNSGVDCKMDKLTYGVLILEQLQCFYPEGEVVDGDIITDNCLTQKQVESLLEKLNHLIGCPNCTDGDAILRDDT